MVVLALIMLKLNLEIIPMQIIYVRIKENSIPTCQTGPFALGHVENFSWDPGRIVWPSPLISGSEGLVKYGGVILKTGG